MWIFSCAVFGASIAGMLANLANPSPMTWGLVQAVVFGWILRGAARLQECGWRASYGRDSAVWIVKDTVAMLIWPILQRWIAHRAETE